MGVPKSAKTATIRKAYRRMAELFHPDKYQRLGVEFKRAAEEQMRKLNVARSVLLDPEKRKEYDEALMEPHRLWDPRPPAAANEVTQAIELIMATKAQILNALELGLDMENAVSLLTMSQYLYECGKFDKSIEITGRAKKLTETAQLNYALQEFKKTRKILDAIKKAGMDSSNIERIFNKARPAIMNNNFVDAIEFATQAYNIAKKEWMDYKSHQIGDEIMNLRLREPILKLRAENENIVELEGDMETLKTAFEQNEVSQSEESPVDPTEQYELVWEDCDINSDDIFHEKELDIYGNALRQAWDDGVLTNDESAVLKTLRQAMNITDETHTKLERMIKKEYDEEMFRDKELEIYENALKRVWTNGVVTDDENAILMKLREVMNITEKDHNKLLQKIKKVKKRGDGK